MAKKKTEKIQRVMIVCKEYKGYLDKMPEDAKLAREARIKKK